MAMLGFVWLLSFSRGLDALVQGDVAVPRSTTGEKVRDSFLLNPSHLWSNGLVPFVFETLQLEGGGEEPIFSDQHKQIIRDAMAHISEQVPCIKFREVLAGYSGAHLIFSCMGDAENDPSGCWAYVGCQGAQGGKGGQTVNYGAEGCFNMGTVVHEILHSLGATHEQNREDRDKYVRIVEDQIIEESKKNFEKKDSLFSSYGTPYDYDSVMHYDEDAFSVSGTKTIVPLIANITLRPVRSKSGMSRIDTMELARVYDSLTTEDCYKRETIMAYLDTVEKMLDQSSHQCPEINEFPSAFNISSTGGTKDDYPSLLGLYAMTTDTYQNQPVYKHEAEELYLFLASDDNWSVYTRPNPRNVAWMKAPKGSTFNLPPTSGWEYLPTDKDDSIASVLAVRGSAVFNISSSGVIKDKYPTALGLYTQDGDKMYNDRPVYKHNNQSLYLYVDWSGDWRVNSDLSKYGYWFYSRTKSALPPATGWIMYTGSWTSDPSVTVRGVLGRLC